MTDDLDGEWYAEHSMEFKKLPEFVVLARPQCAAKNFFGFRCRQTAMIGDVYCFYHRKVVDGLIDVDPELLRRGR